MDAEIKLTAEESQLIADILYTFMAKEALQGISSIETLIDHTISEIKSEVSKEVPMETIKDLAQQIAIPIDGFTMDSRLFAIELETQERTQIRDQLVITLSSKKNLKKKTGVKKADLKKELGNPKDTDFNEIATLMCNINKDGYCKLKNAFK